MFPSIEGSDSVYVHYAKYELSGEWLLPWDALPEAVRQTTGNEARVHADRPDPQWRSDRAYVHKLPPGHPLLNIGTTYSDPTSWVYQVEPTPPIELDPERPNNHLPTSRICPKALILNVLWRPSDWTDENSS